MFFRKKAPAVVSTVGHPVHVNPVAGSETAKARNLARIERLKLAIPSLEKRLAENAVPGPNIENARSNLASLKKELRIREIMAEEDN